MALFDNALAEMAGGDSLEPQPFLHYAKKAGYPNIRTADRISIQNYLGLASELKEAGVMIFRLGNYTKGYGTWFALAKHFGSWSDYFLQDRQLFAHCPQTKHTWYREDLRIFEVLPKSTETSLVNLAIASGIMSTALGLDLDSGAIVNATAQGTYTFSVRPHQQLSVIWKHVSGQVEIDGAFIGHRGGVETLFVIEAKVSQGFESLAKHKLAYPMLALQHRLTIDIPVVGVYLRVLQSVNGFSFYVAECRFSSQQLEIASLIPERVGLYRMEKTRVLSVAAKAL